MSSPAVAARLDIPGTPDVSDRSDPRYRVGTLVYTKAGLAWVFLWLLWGDFCFTLMETVWSSTIPLRLKQLNAPDWVMPIILSTIPSTLNFVLNPVISTASDRHRGRMGRRVPFLLFATPFVSAALVLMAFSPEISLWLHGLLGPASGMSAGTVAVLTLGLLMAAFKFSDMFINTVFWYFFNDVVPQAFMARFLGLFRVVGSLAGMLYSYFLYERALSHMRIIFLAVAALYFVGFTMMCLGVKEGRYPAPTPLAEKRQKGLLRFCQTVRTYFRECLGDRIYRYFFLHNIFWSLAGACAIFSVFLNLSLGLTLAQLGKLGAAVGFASLLLNYPAGALADRFHPLRMMLWMKIALLCIAPLNLVWLFGPFSPQTAFRIMVALSIVNLPLGLIYVAVLLPMQMRILPKDRFGQFCSFNAICQAAVGIGASLVVGQFMRTMRWMFPDDVWGVDYCYRLIPLWNIPFLALGLLFMVLLYREWKRLGGATHYMPPNSLV